MKRGMKKRGAILLSLAMVLSLIGVGPVGSKNALAADKVQLAEEQITVEVKKSKKIKIENIKAKQVKKLTVKSKPKKIAIAKKAGKTEIKVTGKKAGSTIVTVYLKLKKKVAGTHKYTFKLNVNVIKTTSTSTPKPKPIPRYTTEPTLPIADIKVNTVNLPDMTYYLGQMSPSPLDASGTTGSVASTGETLGGNITFKWFAGESKGKEEAVKGATEKTYTPDISNVGTSYVYYTANFVPKDKIIGATGVSNTAKITVLEKVPITFDANGGTFRNADNAKKEVKWGETLGTTPSESDMTAPTSGTNGTDFLGWATTNTATSGNVYSSTKITQAATYYAVWGTKPPETPYVPPAPPSAQTPTATIAINELGGLACIASVTDGGILSYQWYSSMGGDSTFSETQWGNVATIEPQSANNIILEGDKVRVTVTNSKDGCLSSSTTVTYAFLRFSLGDTQGSIIGEGSFTIDEGHTAVIVKPLNYSVTNNDIPTAIRNDGYENKTWETNSEQSTSYQPGYSVVDSMSFVLDDNGWYDPAT